MTPATHHLRISIAIAALALPLGLLACSPADDGAAASGEADVPYAETRAAATAGDAAAQYDLGNVYAVGKEVAQDLPEAVKWYRMAADQGHAPAQNNLGVFYARGEGVQQDYVEAYKWFSLASAATDDAERRQLIDQFMAETSERMTPRQIAEAEALAQDWKPVGP